METPKLVIGKKEYPLEDRGESKRYKKFGFGKFDRDNGNSEIVVSVYIESELLKA